MPDVDTHAFTLMKMWLNRYPKVNSKKFAIILMLLSLWNLQETSKEFDSLLGRISSIRDRYQVYFVHKLSVEANNQDLADKALREFLHILATCDNNTKS